MDVVSDDDSVLEQTTAALLSTAAHPTDPFLSPRRSTGAVSVRSPLNGGGTNAAEAAVSTISTSHIASPTSRAVVKRRRPDTSAATSAGAVVQDNRLTPGRPQVKKTRPNISARCDVLGAVVGGFVGEFNTFSDEESEESAFADHTVYESPTDSVLQDGGGSDDDGDEDVEEKALIAAPSAATPHPWFVTDAFHVSLWYVLRYASSALSAADLWACRALLSLTAVLPSSSTLPADGDEITSMLDRDIAGVLPDDTKEPDRLNATSSGAWAWTGTEESELLLRLVLRKPHGFTARHLEMRYGDWLHVQPAVAALTKRRFLWWGSSKVAAKSIMSPQPEKAGVQQMAAGIERKLAAAPLSSAHNFSEQHGPNLSRALMLEKFDGTRVAQMVIQGGAKSTTQLTNGSTAVLSSATDELVRVLQAVRGTELRLFLTALRHVSKAHATRESWTHDSSLSSSRQMSKNEKDDIGEGNVSVEAYAAERTDDGASSSKGSRSNSNEATYKNVPLDNCNYYDAIPARKRDMICYFVERRYALWAPTPQTVASGISPSTSTTTSAATATLRPNTICVNSGTVQKKRRGDQGQGSSRRNEGLVATKNTKQPTAAFPRLVYAVKRCFSDSDEEALLVARCWDTHVGSVYAPHTGLKAHLVWITKIFHVLTANAGAGPVGQQRLKPFAATMAVAALPTLLMLRPQLLLLESLRSVRLLRRGGASLVASDDAEEQKEHLLHLYPTAAITKRGDEAIVSAAFLNSVPYALLPRWFFAPLSPPRTNSLADRSVINAAAESPHSDSSSICVEDDLVEGEIICSTRSFHVPEVDEGGQFRGDTAPSVSPPVQLFGTPTMLQEYRAALCTHCLLYEVTDGAVSAAQRFRGRNEAFVSHMYDRVLSAVRTGVAAIKRHPLKRFSSPSLASDAARFVSPFPLLPAAFPKASASLDVVLHSKGNLAEHLLVFTPLSRWFSCLELLYMLLQSARRYADAIECLRFLLYEPVYVLHHMPEPGGGSSTLAPKDAARASRGCLSPVTYAFRYKTHKRGEWLHRLAQNLTHLKRHREALKILEVAQSGYSELARQTTERVKPNEPFAETTNETAAAVCSVLAGTPCNESMLPDKVQRRGRMLRVLWPSTLSAVSLASSAAAGDNGKRDIAGTPSSRSFLALYHAVWEYVRDRYCRRQDRLALERFLATLHRRVWQWTPLAAHRQLATRQLAEVAVRRIRGVRDAMDYMLWREASVNKNSASGAHTEGTAGHTSNNSCRPALPVELFVLQHFLNKWNEPDRTKKPSISTRKRQLDSAAQTVDEPVNAERNESRTNSKVSRAVWCGAHCEGQWIRCLAHALLWDCYWSFPSLSAQTAGAPDTTRQVSGYSSADNEFLWFSAFQDGPLDVTTPVNFLLRRRALIEERLAQLERCSREELIRWVAAHIRSDSEEHAQQRSACALPTECTNEFAHSLAESLGDRASNATTDEIEKGEEREAELSDTRGLDNARPATFQSGKKDALVLLDRSEGSALEDTVSDTSADAEEHSALLVSTQSSRTLSQSSASNAFSQRESKLRQKNASCETETEKEESSRADSVSVSVSESIIPEAWKVPVGSLPLLDILSVLPLPPLWRLLRCLYLSSVTEGVLNCFYGFPDLVFWRHNAKVGGEHSKAVKLRGNLIRIFESTPRAAEVNTSTDASPPFCLMEVKSPSDTLSTTQITVNDMLHRCGFQICVSRVYAVNDNGDPVNTKKLR